LKGTFSFGGFSSEIWIIIQKAELFIKTECSSCAVKSILNIFGYCKNSLVEKENLTLLVLFFFFLYSSVQNQLLLQGNFFSSEICLHSENPL